ncbi:reverse transcriptase domain-containing protein [Brucella sp. H1_1004]|uniref:reverse transcriptase domain-containing protein n=1 Tax=Brucella sp. H1_1004 TaxID=3110109 RepID=UPI0039B5B1DB
MPVAFENFLYSFQRNGKPVYAPNEFCEKLGLQIKKQVNKAYKFDSFIYHFKDGSHVVALHKHRANHFFCRIDIARFFYSIQRNRLKRVLKDIGIFRAEYYAKWSTVKNPYEGGGYVIPYGFVQSPILATLVLARSAIGNYLRGLDPSITVSVYMDDICLSGNDEPALREAFEGLLIAVDTAGFTLNDDKTRTTAEQIDIFNCNLEHGDTSVLQGRKNEFYSVVRTPAGEDSFERYCDIVESKTWRVGAKKKRRKAYFRSKGRLPKGNRSVPT